jgi:hypothetical protein
MSIPCVRPCLDYRNSHKVSKHKVKSARVLSEHSRDPKRSPQESFLARKSQDERSGRDTLDTSRCSIYVRPRPLGIAAKGCVAGGLTPISRTGRDLERGQCKIGLIVPNFLSWDKPTMQPRR